MEPRYEFDDLRKKTGNPEPHSRLMLIQEMAANEFQRYVGSVCMVRVTRLVGHRLFWALMAQGFDQPWACYKKHAVVRKVVSEVGAGLIAWRSEAICDGAANFIMGLRPGDEEFCTKGPYVVASWRLFTHDERPPDGVDTFLTQYYQETHP